MKLRPEERIQSAIITAAQQRFECWIAHVPNGGLRSKTEAIRLKATGVRAGFPDLIAIGPDGLIGFLEVKTKDGATSPVQKAVLARMEAWGFPVAVVRSADEAVSRLALWGFPPRRELLPTGGQHERF